MNEREILLAGCKARGNACGAVAVRRDDVKAALGDAAAVVLAKEINPAVGKPSTEYVNIPRGLLIKALEKASPASV